MGVVFFRVKHTPIGGSVSTIYDCKDITVRNAIDAKANNVDLDLTNNYGKNAGKFSENDIVEIYASWDVINESDDLLISGKVKEYGNNKNVSGRTISPNAMDYTYLLLSKLYMPGKFNLSQGLNTPECIKEIIKWISHTENRQQAITTNNVQTTPIGGTTFNDISIALNLKTAYEWLQTLSAGPYTNYDTTKESDRTYIFWIDKNNDLHWKYPSQTVDFSLVDGQNGIISTSLKKSVFDVVNMIIFNCGTGPDGGGISWYLYDSRTTTPDIRIKVQPMIDIARDLQAHEKTLTTFTGEYPSSYNYTTSWGETVTNDATYLGTTYPPTGFRGECISRALSRAIKITSKTANLRWNGTIIMRGTKQYTPGQLFDFTSSDYSMNAQKLRIQEVTQNIGKDCWTTTLSVKQDEDALTAEL